jgi:signal transduction histidine kinase/ligand-binding sensor domain-containing protein
MKILKTILFLVIIISSIKIYGQNINEKIYYDRNLLNYADKTISNLQFQSIVQDNKGYIWVGGLDGITRFNGKNNITFNRENKILSTNITKNLFIDKSGRIWQGTVNKSPSYYNGSRFVEYNKNNLPIFDNLVIYNFCESDRIVVATNKGIFYLDKDQIYPMFTKWLNKNEHIKSVSYLKGFYYISTDKSIYKTDNKNTFEEIYSSNDLSLGGKFSIIDKTLYYSSKNILKLENNVFKTIIKSSDNFSFTSISKDSKGILWFGKQWIYNLNGNKLDSLKDSKSINVYEFCFVDKDNQIWSNNYNGLFVWNKKHFTITDISKVVFRYNNFLKINDNKLIYFDDKTGGLSEINFDGTERKPIINSPIVDDYKIYNFLYTNDQGIILVDGIFKNTIIKYKNNKVKNIYSPSNIMHYGIIKNKKGEILTAGSDGIYILQNDSLKPYLKNKIFKSFLKKIFEDNEGNYWVSGYNKIYYIKNKKIVTINSLFKNNDVIVDNILFYKNKIIISTRESGIYILIKNNNLIQLYDHITKEDGITTNKILNIYIDKFGNSLSHSYYDGENEGFNYIKSITDKEKRQILNINNNYIQSFQLNQIGSSFMDKNTGICRIFIDSTKVMTFDTSILNDNVRTPFTLQMENIELFKKSQNWLEKGYKVQFNNIPENLELKYSDNFLTFKFQALDYSFYSKKLKYYYKIQELDTAWIGPIAENEATFNNIQPGEYTFFVKAVRPNKSESAILKYNFVIKSPWWNTVVFKSFVFLFIILLFVLFTKFRTYNLKKTNEILNEKIKERTKELQLSVNENKMLLTIITHDIKGPLYGISRVIGQLKSNWENENEKNKLTFISNLSNSIQKLSLFTHQILQWLKFKNENEIETNIIVLNEIIKEIIEMQLLLNNSNNNKIEFNYEKELKVISNKQIFTIILSNIIENALKYTNEGAIKISLFSDNGLICISCVDNGKGMNNDQINAIKNKVNYGNADMETSYKFGWNILADLIEKNNMKFEITSEINKGTNVTLYFMTN